MFTGIVTDVGRVLETTMQGDLRVKILTNLSLEDTEIGASIACSGVCLTVVEKGEDWFAVDASSETMDKTSIAQWQVGTRVNLEKSLCLGDELGGHLVYGHVDGVGHLVRSIKDGDSTRMEFEVPSYCAKYIARKGSIAVDGVSLTVNGVIGNRFQVNIIPHTTKVTTLGELKPNEKVNIEVDMLARYVARLQECMIVEDA